MEENTYTTNRPRANKTKVENYPKAYVAGIIIGVILLIPFLLIAAKHQLVGVQAQIFHDVNNLILPSFIAKAMLFISNLLGIYAIAIVIGVSAALKRFRLAWRFFFTVGGSTVVFYTIKHIINEPRPYIMLHNHLHIRALETGPAFPSGHETAATAMALTLWFVLPRKWRWLAFVWIIVVGFSRLYLGVHTPGDLVGGFAVGLISVCFVRLLPNKIAKPLHLDMEKSLSEKGW